MSLVLDKPQKQTKTFLVDRPAWIPDHIIEDWDTCPYAYQTEEELMPAGGPHGRVLESILRLIGHLLEAKDLMLLMDVFMLYRNEEGVKKRIAPDLLLMPHRDIAPSAYDLDVESPPSLVVEVTSPDSHLSDLSRKNSFYLGLGISTYLVIDAVKPNSQVREQINLHVWRRIGGRNQKMKANQDGYLLLPEMGLGIMAKKRELFFKDLESGEIARDAGRLMDALEHQQQEIERQRQEIERQQRALEEEREARLRAEAELERLRQAQGKEKGK